MRVLVALALIVAAVAAVGANPHKIFGGSVTTIDNYPSIVALLYTSDGSIYWQHCGGSIINDNSILTAANCVVGAVGAVYRLRTRVGSTYANSGGVVHTTQSIIVHPNYNNFDLDHDVAIIRLTIGITINNNARAGTYPGPNYNLLDNQVVWTAGWGRTTNEGQVSEQLRHVQIWTVNQNTCRLNYNDLAYTVTENMLCSGWLEVGGRDACVGDFGGPVYHNGVIVGVNSWNAGCGLARYPGISSRVSRFITWIQANA